jgi:hypothetical protein
MWLVTNKTIDTRPILARAGGFVENSFQKTISRRKHSATNSLPNIQEIAVTGDFALH